MTLIHSTGTSLDPDIERKIRSELMGKDTNGLKKALVKALNDFTASKSGESKSESDTNLQQNILETYLGIYAEHTMQEFGNVLNELVEDKVISGQADMAPLYQLRDKLFQGVTWESLQQGKVSNSTKPKEAVGVRPLPNPGEQKPGDVKEPTHKSKQPITSTVYDVNNSLGLTVDGNMTREDLKRAIELDGEDFSSEHAGTLDACEAWLKKNPDIYTVLRNNKQQLVGYINFTPLNKNAYEQFRSGELSDMDLSPEHVAKYKKDNKATALLRRAAKKLSPELVEKFEKNKKHDALFMSIVLDEKYRDKEAIRVLTNGFGNKMKDLESQGINIGRVLCECVSEDGQAFCERMGLATIRDETKDGNVKDVKEGTIANFFNFLNAKKLRMKDDGGVTGTK